MKRRAFIQLLFAAALTPTGQALATIQQFNGSGSKKIIRPSANDQIAQEDDIAADADVAHGKIDDERIDDENITDYLSKIRAPNIPHHDDIYADAKELLTLSRIASRFRAIVSLAGDGNFCIMGFDDVLNFAKTHAKIEAFAKDEIELMERLFARNAHDYGFYGEKQQTKITELIDRRDIYKVPYSGNFLFKGEAMERFCQIRRNMGEDLILTSGIRGMAKQFYLFINKALRFDGNLSLASRSLAPPGYSYHATGDFDVGQRGFGAGNFTENFLDTSIYKRLSKEGYVQYRYGRDNLLGVRFEPWHIKL
ncbi:MAG: M15 family metallopeptidase [Desulfobulbaceae bacterium]|nr:M15 family metallopeptidase [Desulfobulbaceae bacterium]